MALGATLTLAVPAAAGTMRTLAPAASAEVDVSIAKLPGTPAAVAGVSFSINVGIGNAGPDNAGVRLLIELPEGLTAKTGNWLGCPPGAGTLDCGSPISRPELQLIRGGCGSRSASWRQAG